jgi:hypothetical protein
MSLSGFPKTVEVEPAGHRTGSTSAPSEAAAPDDKQVSKHSIAADFCKMMAQLSVDIDNSHREAVSRETLRSSLLCRALLSPDT